MSAPAGAVTPAALLEDLEERVFCIRAPGMGLRRIGAEVELIPVSAETRRILPIVGGAELSSLGLLRRFAAGRGWVEDTAGSAPLFRLPGGGVISWEPGGQIEYSTRPHRSATGLLRDLRDVIVPLCAMAADAGAELLSVGIDPWNPVASVPLRLHSERYLRMDEYFASIGPAGARMMRQTASCQINLDWEDETPLRWQVLNAAAPYLTATFANSALYAGEVTDHRSVRAGVWRDLDPRRTGVLAGRGDIAAEYLGFALGAPVMFMRAPNGEYRPFGDWVVHGASVDAWRTHLTTLFPEVRPKEHIEVRSIDAISPEWYAAPVALLAGITYHRPSLCAAGDLLGIADPGLLRPAGRLALLDAQIAAVARDLFEIGLAGCAALGDEFIDPPDLAVAREFFERYTRQARSPADDLLPAACR